jgi:hypothetical protein
VLLRRDCYQSASIGYFSNLRVSNEKDEISVNTRLFIQPARSCGSFSQRCRNDSGLTLSAKGLW